MSSFADFRRSADAAGAATRPALTAAVVRVGGVEIDMRRHEIRRGGETIRLQQQPFQILALLMEHAGGVVTRQDIERRLWPDGTSVDFEHSVNAAIRRLRVALGDDALEPRFVETVPRRGYRFVGRLDPSGRVDERRPVAAVRPRVLVRPFVVRGETPDDDGLGAALIEELAAQLAHRGADRLDVLTRAPEPGDCAARACYRIEGSIRVAGDRVRVLATLIDGRDETHRWASGYDRDVADIAERHDRRGVGDRGCRRGAAAAGAVRRIGGAGGEERDAGSGRRRGRDRLEPARVGDGDRHQRHALVVVADALARRQRASRAGARFTSRRGRRSGPRASAPCSRGGRCGRRR